jgi:hypothetical protein
MFSLASFAWSIVIFTLSSGLAIFYVAEVFRHAFFTSRDGQEPTPTAQRPSENDLSHGGPKGSGPMDCSGEVGIMFC